RAGKWKEALDLLASMQRPSEDGKRKVVHPNVVTYNAAIKACRRSG
ncbi:unnamed protein product, partial [Discosporangium mesarthrocarpum]